MWGSYYRASEGGSKFRLWLRDHVRPWVEVVGFWNFGLMASRLEHLSFGLKT